ncbi:MAG: LytR C-terminal domain-containing protein [Patescibacteria group bacterium]|nr:LytR C-terminal domain-containing protein [Patescibacteria group bacterium]
MAGKSSSYACVFVDRSILSIYRSDSTTPISIELPPEIVDAIEVIDDDGLVSLLQQALAGEQPEAETIIVFLDATYFTKDVSPDPNDKTKDISPEADEKFAEIVPFETAFARRYEVGNKSYLTVVNADMFYTLKLALEKNRYLVTCAVPEILLGLSDGQIAANSPYGFQQVLKKFEYLKKNSIAPVAGSADVATGSVQEPEDSISGPMVTQSPKPKPSSLTFAVPVLLLLLGVLGFVIYQQFSAPAVVSQTPQPEAVPTLPAVSPVISATATPGPAGKRKTELTIRVLNGSGRSGDANRVSSFLEDEGYRNITTGNADSPNPRETQITFTGNLPSQLRDELRTVLETIEGEIDIREAGTGEADVIILTGSRSGSQATQNKPSEQDDGE